MAAAAAENINTSMRLGTSLHVTTCHAQYSSYQNICLRSWEICMVYVPLNIQGPANSSRGLRPHQDLQLHSWTQLTSWFDRH